MWSRLPAALLKCAVGCLESAALTACEEVCSDWRRVAIRDCWSGAALAAEWFARQRTARAIASYGPSASPPAEWLLARGVSRMRELHVDGSPSAVALGWVLDLVQHTPQLVSLRASAHATEHYRPGHGRAVYLDRAVAGAERDARVWEQYARLPSTVPNLERVRLELTLSESLALPPDVDSWRFVFPRLVSLDLCEDSPGSGGTRYSSGGGGSGSLKLGRGFFNRGAWERTVRVLGAFLPGAPPLPPPPLPRHARTAVTTKTRISSTAAVARVDPSPVLQLQALVALRVNWTIGYSHRLVLPALTTLAVPESIPAGLTAPILTTLSSRGNGSSAHRLLARLPHRFPTLTAIRCGHGRTYALEYDAEEARRTVVAAVARLPRLASLTLLTVPSDRDAARVLADQLDAALATSASPSSSPPGTSVANFVITVADGDGESHAPLLLRS